MATRFLDDVIDYNMPNHALDRIEEAVSSDRRVGLGITGLADALIMMGLKYDSDESLDAVEKIMQTICYYSYETSIDLAQEKGSFPLFDWEGLSKSKFIQGLPKQMQDRIREHGLRNSTLITVPPVGTGSIVAQTSSGVEPIFCTSYTRRVKQADGESFNEYKVYHPLVRDLYGGDDELPDHVITSHDIDPYFRVKMQGVVQRYTDSSISSTINLAEDTSVETVADIYVTAYEEGLKGVTVYREGSREGILQTDKDKPAADEGATAPVEGRSGLHPRQRPAVTRGVTERVLAWGVHVARLDIKDVVLPGDMKVLLNQVIEAEKRAAAQNILRREETAATRSLANTAKLLEANPVLLRLKELELYKELAERIPNLSVIVSPSDVQRQLQLKTET